MNVKRIVAKTSRDAMRQLRELLWPDAVILSNRAVEGGVEVLALPAEDIAAMAPPVMEAPVPAPAAPAMAPEPKAQVRTEPVDFLPVRNEVEWQRYPKAGSPNAVVRLGVIGLETDGTPGPERLVSFTPDDVYVLPQLGWTPDSRHVAFQHLNRGQNELDLRLLPVPSSPRDPLGAPRTVLTEHSKTWLNTFGAPRFLKDGRRFLWQSERDGFAHLYLCDIAGGCRAVTQGPWTVDGRVSFGGSGSGYVLDERSGFLYFTATEKDPRERHLYRVRLDGTGRTRLTSSKRSCLTDC